MQVDETTIRNVVQEVLSRMGGNGAGTPVVGKGYRGRLGQFTDVNEAVAAAREAYEELSGITLAGRKRIDRPFRVHPAST